MMASEKMQDKLILVDPFDEPIGLVDKLAAHREGRLHRAFSVFVFDSQHRMLLQRRALNKYHSGGLWSNACCSHPSAAETVIEAARRRLKQEMGFVCPLWKAFNFIYRAELTGGMIENEYDHVFIGRFDGVVHPNPVEVMDFRWLSISELRTELRVHPKNFTPWFKLAFDQVLAKWEVYSGKSDFVSA